MFLAQAEEQEVSSVPGGDLGHPNVNASLIHPGINSIVINGPQSLHTSPNISKNNNHIFKSVKIMLVCSMNLVTVNTDHNISPEDHLNILCHPSALRQWKHTV